MARRTIHLDDGLDERLVARAAREERSASWCVQRAVEAWLGDTEPLKGADPVSASSTGAVRGAAQSSAAAPRASVVPAFARVQRLGEGPPRTIGRKS